MVKKRRTRQHIIADLSVNFVERLVLRCGHTVQRINNDYGIDLLITTYDRNGEAENGNIYVQLKATDNLTLLADQEAIPFKIRRADLELWSQELMPFLLILYDAQQEVAYWLYVQAYFRQQGIEVASLKETHTLHLKKRNILNAEAIQQFVTYKNSVLQQCQEIIHDEA
ncbi:DUF4365 domain-containing protein [Leptolyngbya sp. AN03gr2]|uniref:DUF4365 domain-containing protein n=1 Tax=unclassified Leptolyngbya TaxID=2650499 RepID=UPI003D321139